MNEPASPNPHEPPTPRKWELRKWEFEDPHYHDDDDLPSDDEQRHPGRPGGPRKPARGIPPPRRRHFDD